MTGSRGNLFGRPSHRLPWSARGLVYDQPTAAGARTSLFVPELSRLYLAAPHRDGQEAEIRVHQVKD
jgi:hypothetical protein